MFSVWFLLTLACVSTVSHIHQLVSDDDSAHGRVYKEYGQNPYELGAAESFVSERKTIDDMTCSFFTQPLNHFVPRGTSPTYEERYCVYDGFVQKSSESQTTSLSECEDAPIFLYTGNESPLEQYINQTGLMWELASKYHARVAFAEHRYEGQSLPTLSKDCMSYASTFQALADYARILETHLNPGNVAPVIVFGGSYGGMLSAWMRMKYPHLVAGAIAASAPIGAFPQIANDKIDSSARVLALGLDKPYPPTMQRVPNEHWRNSRRTKSASNSDVNSIMAESNHCRNNLLAAWPLITWLARVKDNAEFLKETFSLCSTLPHQDASPLLRWAQGIWFDLAEGSFPYPSSYIPFALLHKMVELPPWPMQAACWQVSQLYKNWGVTIRGNQENVKYEIYYGNSNITLAVDWDRVKQVGNVSSRQVRLSSDVNGLLTSVRDAVSIWYNITKDVKCYNVSRVAPNRLVKKSSYVDRSSASLWQPRPHSSKDIEMDPLAACDEEMKRVGSWEPLCCNDEMNLVITEARGLGYDFFWPPSLPRGVSTYKDMIRNISAAPCADPYGLFGYSKEPYELWSTRLDTYYGGISMEGHSNIVFSNGLLDPWSAGGVYKKGTLLQDLSVFSPDGALVQNVTSSDVVSLIIPFGGHHTDLMYSDALDPICVRQARTIEDRFVAKWILGWKATQGNALRRFQNPLKYVFREMY